MPGARNPAKKRGVRRLFYVRRVPSALIECVPMPHLAGRCERMFHKGVLIAIQGTP